jgi:nucleoside-diphosphate-sugar epimerase
LVEVERAAASRLGIPCLSQLGSIFCETNVEWIFIVPSRSETATVLATGGSGFLGRHCLEALVRHGFRVHAVSRTSRGDPTGKIVWHNLDLLSRGPVERLVATLRPSHLLHLAWVTAPEAYRYAPENLDWLDASLALVRSFGEHGGQRFVGVGSCAEYDVAAGACVEDGTPIRPVSVYGQCKAAFWMATQACAQRYGFSSAWGRVFLPYGPGDEPHRLIPSLLTALAAGRPMNVTDGSQVRDFVYAGDVAEVLVRLLATVEATGAYNVGTGRGIAVRQVIEWVADHFRARELVHFGVRPRRDDEPPSLVADMAKIERVLGWRAPTSIESGLERLLPKLEASSPTSSRWRGGVDTCAS